jgi:uncharacterized protein YndB with AHSA1/START domain
MTAIPATSALPYKLDRIITIEAPRDLVFRFLTTNDRWAAWWGKGSEIDARPGGRVQIVHPNGIRVGGEVHELDAPHRIVFTYGYESGESIPFGGSRVAIVLDDVKGATRLHLTHEFAEPAPRDEHVQGWRFQLSLFANIIANEQHARAAELADAWFELWAHPDEAERSKRAEWLVAADIQFRDRFSHLDGTDDVLAHISAAQKFMPGLRLERTGDARQCQGTVIVPWKAVAADGSPRGTGVNIFTLGADGRIASAVGFWD